MRRNYLTFWFVPLIFLILISLGASNQVVNAQTLPLVPGPPTNLVAKAVSSSEIDLSWNPPSNMASSILLGYKIERSTDSGSTWGTIVANTGSTATTYSDTGLASGITYTYRISAINSVGTGSPSNTASATTFNVVPQPPTGLIANAASSSQINLSWTAPANNGGSPITGYEIERAKGNLSFGSFSNSTNTVFFARGNTTSSSDTGLSPSTSYNYTVFAKNSAGTSKASNIASATTPSAATVPQPPTGLTTSTVSSSQINLSWTAPTNNGGSAITGYKIDRLTGSSTTWSTIVPNTGNTATKYNDTGLAAGTTYTYRVSAINSVGTSVPSNTASGTTQSVATQCTPCTLTVTTQLNTGDPVTGMYIELDQNGQTVSSGYSPTNFTLTAGTQYTVAAESYGTYLFDHWLDTGSTANPRAISISTNAQITGVYRDTALTLNPSTGPAGTPVSVKGSSFSFSPNHTISLTWDGTPLKTNPSTITSDVTGGFSASFQVPTFAAGSHKVQATDGTNTHPALFTVGSATAISLNTNSGNIGTSVRITGTGFTPNSPITLTYDSYTYAFSSSSDAPTPSNIQTDSNGGFVGIIAVQHSVAGTHIIAAQDSLGTKATQTITVNPHVFIYPISGPAGSQVLIPDAQGNGFAASSPITMTFDGTTVATSSSITTDTTGNFGGSFAIPSVASVGTHTIQVADNKGNVYSTSFAVTDPSTPTYSIQNIATGLNIPDRLAFIPDNGPGVAGSGNFMVTEKNTGNVIVFKNTNGQFVRQPILFVTVPNLQTGFEDNGLLGIAIDPSWASTTKPSKFVYFYVTRTVSGSVVGEVIRYQAMTDTSGNIVANQTLGEQIVIGNMPNWQDGHNGGCLKFDSSGNLYVTVSDGWGFIVSQDLTTLQGKILRISPLASPVNGQLYSIPSTNPFASSTNTSIKKEIWGYGIRNAYTFDIDSKTGRLYASDVGYSAWERIENFTAANANAGWPNYESPPYGNPQNLPSYTPQIYWYPHEGVESQTAPEGLEAITGAAFYHGTYYPNLEGAYFFADYGVHFINALLPSSTAPPQVEPASGVPKGQIASIYYDTSVEPVDLEVWNGGLYFIDLTGTVNVLKYGSSQPPTGGGSSGPASPTGLNATAVSPSQINLSWIAPSSSLLVTGYKIERSTDSGTTWITLVQNTGSTVTAYSDTGLNQSTIYTYRVSAWYSAVASQPSNTASATTQCAICQLTVTTQLLTKQSTSGFYAYLLNSSGQTVATGSSPATFNLKNKIQYSVGVGNYDTFIFDHWLDNNSTSNPRPITIMSNTQLTALYRDTAPLILNPSSGPAGITVNASENHAFFHSQPITLKYDGAVITPTTPVTINANSTGGFSATFKVPFGSVGPHEVLATNGTSTHYAVFRDTP